MSGEIEISHAGLDHAAIEAPNPVAFVRAALVDSGVLEPRDEYGARSASWQAEAVLEIAAGSDRAHVRAYATWRVAHKLARAGGHRAESSYSSLKYAKSQVIEAIKLVCWLHEQRLELADLRQDLVDDWSPVARSSADVSARSCSGSSGQVAPDASRSSGTTGSRPGHR